MLFSLMSALRASGVFYLFLLPYYRRHAPKKKNRVSGDSMVEFISGS